MNAEHFETFFAKDYEDHAAERVALAYCLDGGFEDARGALSASDFTNADYRRIWTAMEDAKSAGKDINLLSIWEAVGGNPQAVANLMQGDYTAGKGRAAVPYLCELSAFRRIKEVFVGAAASLEAKTAPDKVLSNLIDQARAIQDTAFPGTMMEGAVDLSQQIPEPVALVERGDGQVAHLGDLQMIDGKSKSGKSSVCTAIAAAVLGGDSADCLGFEGTRDGARVLWIDTEQHPRNSAVMARRILRMAGFPTNQNNPRLAVLSWRGKTPAEQDKLLFRTARRFRPQLIVLDGITDLVADFNSVEEATSIVTRLMGLAAELDAAILCVLHTNPGGKGVEQKAIGMIGSTLYRKVSIEILVTAEDDTKDARREVRFLKARNGNPEKFWFTIDETGPHLTTPAPATTGSVEKVRSLIESVLSLDEAVSYGELVSRIVAATGRKERSAKDKIRIAREGGFLKESAAKTLYYEKIVSDYDEDLPL